MGILSFIKIHKLLFLNLAVITFILLLPYYLFSGKLFIGGDDSKLLYIYPLIYLKTLVFYSWHNYSSLSMNNSAQALVPFLTIWTVLASFIKSKTVLDYLSFSLPLILGFIFMQKFMAEIIEKSHKYQIELLLGALFYVFSPIIIQNQLSVFLGSVWLLGIIPIVFFCLAKYFKTSNFLYVLFSMSLCTVFSIGLFAIPWLLGFLLPLLISSTFLLFIFKYKKEYFQKLIVFVLSHLLSQAFWIIPFISSYLSMQKNDIGSVIYSENFSNSFLGTVLSTATGNILYPLLNLFHRQIAFDFYWPLKDVYLNYYDKIIIFNSLFVLIMFFGVINYKSYLLGREKKLFIFILISFLVSLFFFTVNIGPLKEVFLFLGYIPGFVMFRNFYDKFALGYVFFYSAVIIFSMVIIRRKYSNFSKYLCLFFFMVLFINAIPFKNIINRPFWTTKDIYTNVQLPPEYLNFLNVVKEKVQPTSNILSLPFNDASYAVIKEDNSNNVFIGTSPIRILTGINDFSGDLSFDAKNAAKINIYITGRDYKNLNSFMEKFNINYVLVTKKIPEEIKQSFLYINKDFSKQDANMVNAITGRIILKSEKGNYLLYSAKKQLPLFISKNIKYQKINSVMFNLYITNLKEKTRIIFRDSYNSGWKLYPIDSVDNCDKRIIFEGPIIECKDSESLFQWNELSYPVKSDIFGDSHVSYKDYGNEWILDPIYIKNNLDKKFYTINKDGSINLSLNLYFYPQLYFYLGALVSVLTFVIAAIYVLRSKRI